LEQEEILLTTRKYSLDKISKKNQKNCFISESLKKCSHSFQIFSDCFSWSLSIVVSGCYLCWPKNFIWVILMLKQLFNSCFNSSQKPIKLLTISNSLQSTLPRNQMPINNTLGIVVYLHKQKYQIGCFILCLNRKKNLIAVTSKAEFKQINKKL
jgi:hypothetical protein